MKRIKRLIKKLLMPDMAPDTYNRKDRRTQLKSWENRQRRKDKRNKKLVS